MEKHTSVERLRFAWWWKHRYLKASLVDYLATQHDRGRSLAYAYEAVARHLGGYLLGKPFNLLEFAEAEDFATAYILKPNPIHGFAFLMDPLCHYTDRAKRGETISGLSIEEEHKHENHMRAAFSAPFVIRFNLHQPAGSIAKQIKGVVSALQEEAGISITQKNRETPSYCNLESWDLRRWKYDKVDDLKIDEELKMKIRAPITNAGTTRITKARKYAMEAFERHCASKFEISQSFIPYDGRGMVVNPYW